MPPRRKKKADSEKAEERTEIVAELESGQQPLQEALEKFERGMQLLKTCSQQLDEATGRIEIVRRMTEDGAEVEPFDGTATVDRQQSDSAGTESGNLF